MTTAPAKIAFLILSDDPARAIPGLVMATRLKENRGLMSECSSSARESSWPAPAPSTST
jgi:hypothetical protein